MLHAVLLISWSLSAWRRSQSQRRSRLRPRHRRSPETRQEILQRQREEKRGQLEPYVISGAEERVKFLETWRLPFRLFSKGVGGFRPVVGGLPSGSGLVGGGGYITGYNSDLLQFTASARYSTRGYQAYDAGLLIFPPDAQHSPRRGIRDGWCA